MKRGKFSSKGPLKKNGDVLIVSSKPTVKQP